MNAVSVRTNDERREEHSRHDESPVSTIEAYETDDGTVFFDAENPLAWMETARALTLEELA